ncbi:hypothetical protein VTO42DRAFT_5284 [Malbranchea cinnamomea]
MLLAGDLNLKHLAWQLGSSPNRQAEPFLQWTTNNNLFLTMELGTPTRGTNMLDHAWTTQELVQIGVNTWVEDRLYTSSDHKTLLTRISLPRQVKPDRLNRRFQIDTMDENTDQLDALAQGITDTLIVALEASTKKTTRLGIDQPCSLKDAKRHMRRVIRKAKQEYWHSQIANASEGKDIFRIVKWAHSTSTFHSPPLRDEEAGIARTEPKEKRELLKQTLLQRAACKEDISIDWTSYRPARLPFPEITAYEIQNSLLNTGNTTPGTDNVPTEHPTPFKEAILVALAKPNRDPANPRSYCLIALLSTLGKGLERLVARRLAWTAIREKVVHPQHFGALPGRLQEQGWPRNLIEWVKSFMTGRTGRIKMDGLLGDSFSIPAGLPQGSPVSPILFTLFIQPMFFLGTLVRKRARMGYADDIALLSAGTSLEDNVQILQEDFKLLNSWAADEGLTFDTGKSELAYFTHRRCNNNPAIELDTGAEAHSINAALLDSAVHYLGIWLDRKLSFRKHVDTIAAKAWQVAGGIQALSNTVRGTPVQLLRQAVQACPSGTTGPSPTTSSMGSPTSLPDHTYCSTTSQEAPAGEARRQGSLHTPLYHTLHQNSEALWAHRDL